MPITFKRKVTKAPLAIVQLNLERPMPTVASGGTKATAIAIPGKVSLILGLAIAKEAAMPAIMAIAASSSDGCVRSNISWLVSIFNPKNKETTKAAIML